MASLANILAGQRVLAALLQAIAPLAAYKGADESVTSSTALQNDDALFVPLAASAGYFFVCFLDYEGGTQGASDMKLQWTGPSGASLSFAALYYPTSGGVGANTNISVVTALSTVLHLGTDGAGVKLATLMFGSVLNGANAGNLQLQWAQNTSSGTPVIVHAGSVLAAWQVQ